MMHSSAFLDRNRREESPVTSNSTTRALEGTSTPIAAVGLAAVCIGAPAMLVFMSGLRRRDVVSPRGRRGKARVGGACPMSARHPTQDRRSP